MTILRVAADVVRESFAGKLILGIFGIITAGLCIFMFALDLEVVDGALAASRLFGNTLDNGISPVDVALRDLYMVMVNVVFYGSIVFGVLSTADIAPRMLAPGRVELMLSLPVRRAELVAGTYVGVAFICACASVFALGGVTIILYTKTGYFTPAPFFGALCAFVAFLPIYAVMLVATSLVRSAALAGGVGFAFAITCIAASDRTRLAYLRPWIRDVTGVLAAPLPRLQALGQAGADAVAGSVSTMASVHLVLTALAFAACALAIAAAIVSGKDY
jgi:ABC-type transport system involved in multi-copper enzyme maturation permease subunit